MNINSQSSLPNLFQLLEAQAAAATKSAAGTTSTTSSLSTTATSSIVSDSSVLSGPAKLFGALDKLSQSNPTEFKKITSEISQELQTAATNSTDPAQAQFLTDAAANFSKASQSGKF